uniref:CX domain-containing protein n=1 Tax=Steinernema glaseri TaxID=37863 RepID=A0A1I8ABR2_9BILA
MEEGSKEASPTISNLDLASIPEDSPVDSGVVPVLKEVTTHKEDSILTTMEDDQASKPEAFQTGSVSGPGSASSGSHFKTALAGAAIGTVGGLLAFEAGKAILHSADKPFQNNDKDYYFGQQYVPNKAGEIRCTMPLNDLINSIPAPSTAAPVEGENGTTPSANQVLQTLTFPNGTRPHEVAWACKQGTEVCCDLTLEFFSSPSRTEPDLTKLPGLASKELKFAVEPTVAPLLFRTSKTMVILIAGSNPEEIPSPPLSSGSTFDNIPTHFSIIAVLLLICCCGFCIIYHFCRSLLDCIMPRKDEYQYDQNQSYQQQTTQGYPMQQYPNNYDQSGAYPTQPAYPGQPQGYQQGYPPQPHVGYAPAHY